MTEIERLLTDTFAALEKELRQTQEAQEEQLADQQGTLTTHESILQRIQQQITILSAQQQESTQHLQRLSAVHKNLEPLLERLSGILSNAQNWRGSE